MDKIRAGKIDDGLPDLIASIESSYYSGSTWCLRQSKLEYLAEIYLEPLPARCYKAGDYILTFLGFDVDYPDFLMFDVTKD